MRTNPLQEYTLSGYRVVAPSARYELVTAIASGGNIYIYGNEQSIVEEHDQSYCFRL